MTASELRAARARVLSDTSLGGAAFGTALAAVLDDYFERSTRDTPPGGEWTLLALGSYSRRELCPGSDVDVMLLHDGRGDEVASALWYPLWDAGFTVGHSTRTLKEALKLADGQLDTLTSLLDVRVIAGQSEPARELALRARRLAGRRRARLVRELAAASRARAERPGPVAEMLAPDLKDGAGGLRDIQALDWIGRASDAPEAGADRNGLDVLVERGYLAPDDPDQLRASGRVLLEVRVALHQVTGGRSDLLALQDQDAVAARLRDQDADALIRRLADAARVVTWLAGDAWDRLEAAERGPSRTGRDRDLGHGVVLRDGRITVARDAVVDATLVLRAAAAAATHHVPFERGALTRLGSELAGAPGWGPAERAAFVELLRSGWAAVPVVESLDHVDLMVRILPEWAAVRSLPQRNAYHRFTVDRHLLEAVAECAAILEEDGIDGYVARGVRADLLLLGALLHDIGKGRGGDHSTLGSETARSVGMRMGLEAAAVETLEWLVQHHLLLADTATRRDLGDEVTITRCAQAVGTVERLDLLYVLTVGDSRATGPAAWSTSKAALVRELYSKTTVFLEHGTVAMPVPFAPDVEAHHRELVTAGTLAVEWADRPDGRLECTVAAPDRKGLLATVAGALALHGFDVHDAAAFSHPEGMAIEVFGGHDRFGRLDGDGRIALQRELAAALEGGAALADRLADRARRYRNPGAAREAIGVTFDLAASETATVVEVHAPDEVGLLARVATAFASLDLDVSLALVSTLGDRVVDVFYVQDAAGAKLTDPLTLDRLKATLIARLTSQIVSAP